MNVEKINVCGFSCIFVNFMHKTIESLNLRKTSSVEKTGPWKYTLIQPCKKIKPMKHSSI
jgi:hypothetical protein